MSMNDGNFTAFLSALAHDAADLWREAVVAGLTQCARTDSMPFIIVIDALGEILCINEPKNTLFRCVR